MKDTNSFDRQSDCSIEVQNKLQQFKNVLENNRDQLWKIGDVELLVGERQVELLEKIEDSVVCTTYFTSKTDPQRNIQVNKDDIKYIEPWYLSIQELNLFGIVFYDDLSEDFIQRYQTYNIRFIKCKLGGFSLNDERFIIYYIFFLHYSPSFILLTDGNDVTFKSNPFQFFEQKKENTIFVGRGQENKIYQSDWNINSVVRASKSLGERLPGNFFDLAIYNAGIIGGYYTTTMYFLRQISSVLFKINNNKNNNMAAMHYVLYYYFYPNCRHGRACIRNTIGRSKKIMRYIAVKMKLGFIFNTEISYGNDRTAVSEYIFSGFPLNSKFKKFETSSTAYIVHK